jgi:ATP-dependent DNA helicase RecG
MTKANDLDNIKGCGQSAIGLLSRLGIASMANLIDYYPRRYNDYSDLTMIGDIKPGAVCFRAKFTSVKARYIRAGLHLTEAAAEDASGKVKVTWFNQPYRAASIKSGEEYFVAGTLEFRSGWLSVTSPSIELVKDFPLNTARIVPIYRETKGLKSTSIRKFVHSALETLQITETLSPDIVADNQLISRELAVKQIHFPSSPGQLTAARYRLGFEEIFCLAAAAELNISERGHDRQKIAGDIELVKDFVGQLQFRLTDDQRVVAWTIIQELASTKPVNRLVEGDVGSGKTMVAALAALYVVSAGKQVVIMAPTEILARQHYQTFSKILPDVQIELLVGAIKNKSDIYAGIASGGAQIIIGTTALIQSAVEFHDLQLVIIDEQHRFGVEQRKALQAKAKHLPNIVSLTATPIPRSLALTLYGDLDISVIAQKPPGRIEIATGLANKSTRDAAYIRALDELARGNQIYVIAPAIEESEDSTVNVNKLYEQLSKDRRFTPYGVGLLHGRMKPEEKDAVMTEYAAGVIKTLVSTTVIEVGVDVAKATYMIIEDADKFGLAQMHQLRGRVGRSDLPSYCTLVSYADGYSARLKAMSQSTDGFALAELDLELRGPGAIYGRSQSGQLDLRIANLSDKRLIKAARDTAKKVIKNSLFKSLPPLTQRSIINKRKLTSLD